MKVQDIITEAKSKYDPVDVAELDLQKLYVAQGKKIVAFIKKNCKPWLKETNQGKHYVYRGFDSVDEGKLAFTKVTRLNRQPKDSSKRDHDIMNQIIEIAGKTANRSNSMFVSGDFGVASVYGSVYVLLPVGKFNYTWHTQIGDWMGGEIADDAQLSADDVEIDKSTEQKLIAKLKNQYQDQYGKQKKSARSEIAKLREVLAKFGWKGKPKTLIDVLLYTVYSITNMTSSKAKGAIQDSETSDAYAEEKLRGAFARAWLASKGAQRAALTKLVKDAVKEAESLGGNAKKPTEKEFIAKGLSSYKQTKYKKMPAKDQVSIKAIKRKIVPKIKGDDGTLAKAIKTGNEIMISSQKTLAINPAIYKSIVIPLLHNQKPKFADPEFVNDNYDS